MMASFEFQEMTSTLIDQAESADDLLQILRSIPLTRLKDFVHSEMNIKTTDEVRSICVRSCPIDDILSNDAVQTMLSFLPHQSSNKLVSQRFKRLVIQNQAVTMGQLGDDKAKWCEFTTQKRGALRRSVRGLRAQREQSVSALQSKFEGIIDCTLQEMDAVLQRTPYQGDYAEDDDQELPRSHSGNDSDDSDQSDNEEEDGGSHQSKICGHCLRIVRDRFAECG